MKKWIGPLFSLLLVLMVVTLFTPFRRVTQSMPGREEKRELPYSLVQRGEKEEKKEEIDPHFLQFLKKSQEQMDEWLKSLNERIESQDVTRFEVRFLEILRHILEWAKDKIDGKVESYEKQKPFKKEKGLFRETIERYSPFSAKG